MFHGAEEFNQDLSGWDVRKSYNFNSMFRGARVFNQDLSTWDVRKGYFFVSARRIRLVWYDTCSHSSLLYCIIFNSIHLRMVCFVGRGCLIRI